MSTTSELQARVAVKIEETLGKLDCHPGYGIKFKRMGQCAGKYNRKDNVLTFDPLYLQNHTEVYLNTTVPHEVCHMVQWLKYTEQKHHGPIWKSLMHQVGVSSNRTTSAYEIILLRKAKTITFTCECMAHQLTVSRAAKVQDKKIRVRCKSCRGILVLK